MRPKSGSGLPLMSTEAPISRALSTETGSSAK